MREILSGRNFTIHVFVAVAVTTVFELLLKAPLELVAAMLALGGVSAFTERMRWSAKPRVTKAKRELKMTWQEICG